MGLFDRIPSNFKPGNLFQLGRGAKLTPAGAGATTGSLLQYDANGNWIGTSVIFPAPSTATEGDMLYYHNGVWTLLDNPVAAADVLVTGVAPNYTPQWSVKVSPSAIGLTTNGDLVTQASGVLDRIAVGAASTVLRGGTSPTYGTIDNTYIDNRTRYAWFPATNFILFTGTPDLNFRGGSGRYNAWAFDPAGTEGVSGQILIPSDAVTGNVAISLYWTNLGAGSGDVRWEALIDGDVDGDNIDTATGFSLVDTTITAPAQNVLKISTLSNAVSVAAGALLIVEIVRLGANAADTLANDCGLLGVRVEYTADM